MFLCQSKIDSVSRMLLFKIYTMDLLVNCCDLIYCLILHFQLVNRRNVKWKGTYLSVTKHCKLIFYGDNSPLILTSGGVGVFP